MSAGISFFVASEPRAKQSFRVGHRGGYTPARIKAWQADVGWAGQQAMRQCGFEGPLQGNLTVELVFILGNLRRIDLDNLSKAVQDGLNGIVWDDDKQNIRLVIDKYVCRTRQGVYVKVSLNNRAVEVNEAELPFQIGAVL